jgi:hypothetical protein
MQPSAARFRNRIGGLKADAMSKRLMDGFPPRPGTQVTLANWRTTPFNKWAFHHVREILPTADIANEPAKTYGNSP